ncbi:hypothetical protein CLM62_07680 [Streptomyces sp. SA15]|uniref:hypothetical protein n=1 Tax=Streptomyces sp. SA15 TaxID=934019 RepID=UPI000BAF0F63|nr:hypothetical protein [Streptomyces sp. SA15]PAZ16444.1 hypothetical protein CLM62_07680 [Streptomyces sp. SA15]
MAEGDEVAGRGIRVRLEGDATESDVGALRKWLEREKPLDELVRSGRLQIHERSRGDETGAPMGVGMEIVVALTGGAASVVFRELLDQVKRAVEAWRANRSEVEDGEPPEARVDTVDPDDR